MNLDEHPKPKTTIEQLAKLPTVFKKVSSLENLISESCYHYSIIPIYMDVRAAPRTRNSDTCCVKRWVIVLFQNGVVTAGSASGICDGAAAVIIARCVIVLFLLLRRKFVLPL
jgi:acetyl-CoA acetyltransferase